jgi:hypothetical protein
MLRAGRSEKRAARKQTKRNMGPALGGARQHEACAALLGSERLLLASFAKKKKGNRKGIGF